MIEDRISCLDCAELVRSTVKMLVDNAPRYAHKGDCLAAIERRRLDVSDRYGPADIDLPRRCEFFRAKPGAEDQRSGAERYPALSAEYDAWLEVQRRFRRDAATRGIVRAKAAIQAGKDQDGPRA